VDASASGSAFTLNVDGTTLEGFTVRNSSYFNQQAGINVVSSHNIISQNRLSNLANIRLYSLNNTVRSNLIMGMDRNHYPVHWRHKEERGVELFYSINCTIVNNSMTGVGVSLGGDLTHWTTHTMEGNTVNGRPMYYIKNRVQNIIRSNYLSSNQMNGISLSQSSRNTLTGNRIVNSSVNGIDLSYSDNNTVSQNTISGNACGIAVFRSSLNKINMNNVSSNSGKGIQLWSSYNEIYLNNFMDNDPNADTYSSPVNNWSSTSRLYYTYHGENLTNYLGNYWDDYEGPDTDADGIGDAFYEITGDRDEYPLMQPIGEEGFEIRMKEGPRVDFIYLLAFCLCCMIAKRLTPRRLAQDHGASEAPVIVLGFLRSR